MGYYMGDYGAMRMRRAGYFRGDPGFFSFLGGVARSALGFIPGVGPILSKGADIIAQRAGSGSVGRAVDVLRGASAKVGSAIVKHPALTAAGAAGAVGAVTAGHAILTRGGGDRGHRVLGGRRRRRMNVCNPKALRKAIRRTHGFAKLAMRTIHLVHPKKKARFGGFRRKRARK